MTALPEPTDLTSPAEKDRYRRGLEVLAAISGVSGPPPLVATMAEVSPGLAHHLVASFADIYTRPALSPRDRQLVVLGVLTTLGTEPQIENQVGAALHVGLTPEEIVEAILQTAPVGGITRAQNATMAAARVFERRGVDARPTV